MVWNEDVGTQRQMWREKNIFLPVRLGEEEEEERRWSAKCLRKKTKVNQLITPDEMVKATRGGRQKQRERDGVMQGNTWVPLPDSGPHRQETPPTSSSSSSLFSLCNLKFSLLFHLANRLFLLLLCCSLFSLTSPPLPHPFHTSALSSLLCTSSFLFIIILASQTE